MLSHNGIWAAIDRLAERHKLSPSGLARKAGLDATTFNRSKRIAADGRPRWPSTESIAKILAATGEPMAAFLEPPLRPARVSFRTVPRIGLTGAGSGGYFTDGGFAPGAGWEEIAVPGQIADGSAYALEVAGDSMLPLYRAGDVIVVSPAAEVRVGDRVVAKTRDGEVMAKVLARRTKGVVVLRSLNPDHPDRSFRPDEFEWIARVLWASQ